MVVSEGLDLPFESSDGELVAGFAQRLAVVLVAHG